MTSREMRLAVLRCLQKEVRQHRVNLLGRPRQRGRLEGMLGVGFDDETRARFAVSMDQLKRDGLISADYSVVTEAESWLILTARGKTALERSALDSLDDELNAIDPRLAEMREAAWHSWDSGAPDSLRQATDAMRECIDQTVRALAPNDAVQGRSWFVANPEVDNGITRADRVRHILECRGQDPWEGPRDQLVAAVRRLSGLKHPSRRLELGEVGNALASAELALKAV